MNRRPTPRDNHFGVSALVEKPRWRCGNPTCRRLQEFKRKYGVANGSDFGGLHGLRMAKDKRSKSSHKQKQTQVPSNFWLVRSPPPQQPLPPDNAYEAEIPFRESRSSEEDSVEVKSIAEERSDEKSEPDTASNASSAIALFFYDMLFSFRFQWKTTQVFRRKVTYQHAPAFHSEVRKALNL